MQSNSLNRPVVLQAISSRVVGVLVLVFVETMFFSALISTYFVIKKGRDIWNAAGTIQLPALATGFNTLILLASALFLLLSGRALKKHHDVKAAAAHLFRAIIFGGFFILFQIYLGVQLVQSGLTISSSVFGGCYYLLLGAHLSQAFLGTFFMIRLFSKINSGTQDTSLLRDYLNSLQIFWLFVVGIWPVIYAEIYF